MHQQSLRSHRPAVGQVGNNSCSGVRWNLDLVIKRHELCELSTRLAGVTLLPLKRGRHLLHALSQHSGNIFLLHWSLWSLWSSRYVSTREGGGPGPHGASSTLVTRMIAGFRFAEEKWQGASTRRFFFGTNDERLFELFSNGFSKVVIHPGFIAFLRLRHEPPLVVSLCPCAGCFDLVRCFICATATGRSQLLLRATRHSHSGTRNGA